MPRPRILFHTQERRCPHCACSMNCLEPIKGVPDLPPDPGSVAVCWKCGELMIFTETFEVRKPTAEEAAELALDPGVVGARREWKQEGPARKAGSN